MKNIIFFITIIITMVFTVQDAFAQKDSSGVYKTAEDFQQRKLSYAINCSIEKHKINPNVLFNASELKVKHRDSSYTFKKSEVFGYRACDGQEYKFVDNAEYAILNPGETLILYFYQNPAYSSESDLPNPPAYFFSKDAATPILLLTKYNLKAAFPDSHKFHDALEENFKEDKELADYDSFHNMYKLSRVMKNSLN